jgi:ketosteroid isomerase-like protein
VGAQEEDVVHSWISSFAAQDLVGIMDLYSDDAAYHVAAWREPVVGRDAIRAEIAQQFDRVTDDKITILSMLSTDGVVFFEAVDDFKFGAKDVTLHWASVWEIGSAGKITVQRDYWDGREMDSQISPPGAA